VPFQLSWQKELAVLSKLHRQMYWVYGGYVVLAIVSFAAISMLDAEEIASGSGLARGFCLYVAVFWDVRGCLQLVFDVKEHLTAWWLKAGYHLLTVLFLCFTACNCPRKAAGRRSRGVSRGSVNVPARWQRTNWPG
jgi:uncharacterized membrane protein YhaH (DUF805 family)